MLIPVTPPTQCVAGSAKCGFSGQANTAWGPSPKRSPIQYGRPSYIGAYVRTKCTSQNSSCACNRVVAYRGYLTHKPMTACYLVLPDGRHVRIGIGCAMAVERRVWANEISTFSYPVISVYLTYGNGKFARTKSSLWNDLPTAFACHHLRLKYVYRCQVCEALYSKVHITVSLLICKCSRFL